MREEAQRVTTDEATCVPGASVDPGEAVDPKAFRDYVTKGRTGK